MSETLLELKEVSFAYEGEREAIKHISTTVCAGEKIAVLGGNGAGKSTFFLICNGVLHPDSGEIFCKGKKIGNTRKDKLYLRQTVGIVFQEPDNQILAATVAQEISFGPMNLKLPRKEVEARVEEALNTMHLKEYASRPPHYLSGGEKKRVTIADILAMKPEVMLFDEPTASLDPANVELLGQTLKQLSDDGMTLLISTHDVDFAWRWAERILVFSNGELIADGDPQTIFSDAALLKCAGLRRPLLFAAGDALRRAGLIEHTALPRDITEFTALAERIKR